MRPDEASLFKRDCGILWLEDNSYFKDLLNKKWTKATAQNGKPQYWSGKTMMLTTDMALIEDPKFRPCLGQFLLKDMFGQNLGF